MCPQDQLFSSVADDCRYCYFLCTSLESPLEFQFHAFSMNKSRHSSWKPLTDLWSSVCRKLSKWRKIIQRKLTQIAYDGYYVRIHTGNKLICLLQSLWRWWPPSKNQWSVHLVKVDSFFILYIVYSLLPVGLNVYSLYAWTDRALSVWLNKNLHAWACPEPASQILYSFNMLCEDGNWGLGYFFLFKWYPPHFLTVVK